MHGMRAALWLGRMIRLAQGRLVGIATHLRLVGQSYFFRNAGLLEPML